MEQNHRTKEALTVAVLMLIMSTTALVGLGYILTTGTASGSFQTLTVLLNSDPLELEKDAPVGSNEPGMFSMSMSTHKVNGRTLYEVEGGEAYLLVHGDKEHFTLKASTDHPEYDMELALYEGDVEVDETKDGCFDEELDCDTVYKVNITSFCGISCDDETELWSGEYESPDEGFSLSFTATETD